MDKESRGSFDTWSSRMVSGVEFRCKVKVPTIPNLPTLNEISSSTFEYDFLHEKQVIADYDEYFNAKKNLNETLSTSLCAIPQGQSNPLQESNKQGIELPRSFHFSDPQSRSSYNSCPASVIGTPPPAASHLVSGKILEPSIIDSGASSQLCKSEQMKISNNNPECSSSELIHMKPDSSTISTICTYLKDFDIQPDDPFTMTELKTINELEELKEILMHDSISSSCQPQPYHSTTNDIISNDSEGSSVTNCSNTHSVNSEKLSYSPFSSSENKHQTCKFPETTNSFQNNSCFISNHISDHQVQRRAQDVAISNGLHNSSGFGNAPTRFIKLSKPFVNSCVPYSIKSIAFTNQPQAFGGVAEQNSLINTEKSQDVFQISTIGMRTPDPHHSQIKLLESLLSWATNCGFSHSHARRLLELGVQKRAFTCQNLEQNKLILLNLLHTFNSLLTTFSTNQNSHKLSEQSALLITVTHPNNLFKAQQLARLVIYLEQRGFSQDIVSRYIQNPHSMENEEVTKLINDLTTLTSTVHQVNPINFPSSKSLSMKSPEK
ncbi:unnamed protein product [Schistosoma spindalis]|nr:unnamed protein product [Schistosoma spindale]